MSFVSDSLSFCLLVWSVGASQTNSQNGKVSLSSLILFKDIFHFVNIVCFVDKQKIVFRNLIQDKNLLQVQLKVEHFWF